MRLAQKNPTVSGCDMIWGREYDRTEVSFSFDHCVYIYKIISVILKRKNQGYDYIKATEMYFLLREKITDYFERKIV